MAAAVAAASASAAGGAAAPADGDSMRITGPLSLGEFELGPIIGVGSFSRVYVATHVATGKVWAIKALGKAECVRLLQSEHVASERAILADCSHPFIAGFGGSFQNARYAYLVMEFAQGGELFTHLRKAGRLRHDAARFFAGQVVLALDYLHRRGVIYRDVKPENVVLDARGYVRLVDFGFAKRVSLKTYTLCGTPEYIAPEMLLNRGHGRAVDWWALGVLVYELLAGQPPFVDDDPMGVYGQVIQGKVLFPKYFQRGARSLIKRLLHAHPAKRLGSLRRGASDVREHRFFEGIDWDSLYAKDLPAPIVPDLTGPTDVTHFDPYPDEPDDAPMPAYEGEDPFTSF